MASNNSNENWNNNIDNDNFSDDRVIVDSGAARDALNDMNKINTNSACISSGKDISDASDISSSCRNGVLNIKVNKSSALKDCNSNVKRGDLTTPVDDTRRDSGYIASFRMLSF